MVASCQIKPLIHLAFARLDNSSLKFQTKRPLPALLSELYKHRGPSLNWGSSICNTYSVMVLSWNVHKPAALTQWKFAGSIWSLCLLLLFPHASWNWRLIFLLLILFYFKNQVERVRMMKELTPMKPVQELALQCEEIWLLTRDGDPWSFRYCWTTAAFKIFAHYSCWTGLMRVGVPQVSDPWPRPVQGETLNQLQPATLTKNRGSKLLIQSSLINKLQPQVPDCVLSDLQRSTIYNFKSSKQAEITHPPPCCCDSWQLELMLHILLCMALEIKMAGET